MYQLIIDDVRAGLKQLPDESVHVCITSTPYYCLRDYKTEPQLWGGDASCAHEWVKCDPLVREASIVGSTSQLRRPKYTDNVRRQKGFDPGESCGRCGGWRGELGHEPNVGLFIQHLVEIFRDIRRVLHPSGTCWIVIGDSYARWKRRAQATVPEGSLLLVPERLSIALQDDGWLVRQRIIWAKGTSFSSRYHGAVMPEPVKNRPTSSSELVLMLAKSPKYFYDREAVKDKVAPESLKRITQPSFASQKGGPKDHERTLQSTNRSSRRALANFAKNFTGERNLRSVWLINPAATRDEHFAPYPPKLIAPIIKLATSERGVCANCGWPWRRIIEKGEPLRAQQLASGANKDGGYTGKSKKNHAAAGVKDSSAAKARILASMRETLTVGWEPTCKCSSAEPLRQPVVLDPFVGRGTTLVEAIKLRRYPIGIELSPVFAAIAAENARKAHEAAQANPEQVILIRR